jgi:hypothetical protein
MGIAVPLSGATAGVIRDANFLALDILCACAQ